MEILDLIRDAEDIETLRMVANAIYQTTAEKLSEEDEEAFADEAMDKYREMEYMVKREKALKVIDAIHYKMIPLFDEEIVDILAKYYEVKKDELE